MRARLVALVVLTATVSGSTLGAGSRLAQALSPYLQAHASDAVDWWPWAATSSASRWTATSGRTSTTCTRPPQGSCTRSRRSYLGDVSVVLPLRARERLAPGETPVRLRVTFQVCDAKDCRAPESAIVEALLVVAEGDSRAR